jgi:hypothetical protein
MIRDEKELHVFKNLTKESEWVIDHGDRGGRGIGLDDLLIEKRQILTSLINADSFSDDAPDQEAPELPCETVLPDSIVSGENPDSIPSEADTETEKAREE